MGLTFWQAFAPVRGLFINIVVQIVSFRLISRLSLLKSAYVGFGTGFISLFVYEVKEPSSLFITNLIIYTALGYCYFHFINLGETARRIRILLELYDSMEGLSIEELLNRYNSKEIFKKRIRRLVYNGQIIFNDGKYYIGNPLMFWIARIMVFMKLTILGTKSEFDLK